MIAVVEKGECSVGMKAEMARKAGYKGLMVVGGRDYDVRKLEELVRMGVLRTDNMVFDESQAYPMPVVVVDKEEHARSLHIGAQVSFFMQAVKIDGRTQIKDAAVIATEGDALIQQQRYDEAAARLYIGSLLDPRLVHLQFLLLKAQFLRDCAPPTKSSFMPPSAYDSYHQMTTATPATQHRSSPNASENSVARTDNETSQQAQDYGLGCRTDPGWIRQCSLYASNFSYIH
jgi:hypothetical protein